ncbi:hypothetical protein [Lysinibacillus sphaericus]|uniref:Uncharacterized protein n=1 Tax=Lysinibacillus sphaericus OT4b.31 TaxID=1285586 RepID=R7ZDR1_LYSSH|nr:hypothetical protein [Lysinibacillus sphaericus]EON72149.1 hypothetical protein H131_12723 [Lysinibacillus sphaericus OT4b.31]
MEKDTIIEYQYPEHQKRRHNGESTELYVIKITKEQVDRLIEDIDKTLKTSNEVKKPSTYNL